MANPNSISVREVRHQEYKIVTFKTPILWTRTDDETWIFNPPRRYILNANHLEDPAQPLMPYVDSISDLKGSRHYQPLLAGAGVQLRGARILVERHRDRGIGDLLFLTGPLNYLQHLSGGMAHIDLYGLADRGAILASHPAIAYGSVLAGPILYDDLPHYDYHWFVDSVTEHDETKDQLNVYDALYKQLGINPASVPAQFKRPSLTLTPADASGLDSLYYIVYQQTGLDLRTQPYYVLAPVSNSTLRTAPYSFWLGLAQEMSKVRPVVFVGHVGGDHQVPEAGMTFGAFHAAAGKLGPRVVNLMGNTSLRTVAALLAHALCAVTLDSGLLYVAQAVNTPAVSLWGTHAPHTRLGYDQAYMRWAIHKKQACPASPCYAYAGFPTAKCVRREQQRLCEPLAALLPSDVLSRVTEIEKSLSPAFIPAPASAPQELHVAKPD